MCEGKERNNWCVDYKRKRSVLMKHARIVFQRPARNANGAFIDVITVSCYHSQKFLLASIVSDERSFKSFTNFLNHR